MPFDLSDKLVIGISSRALFDLEEENAIYEQQGVSAYADWQHAHEDEPLALWQAVCLEEEWQADLWGHDWEAEERRARREADFLRACAFARLARG